MKKQKFVGKLIYYKTGLNSVVGGPRYTGIFETENGETIEGKTASNASCAYSFLNYISKKREVIYHETRKGNIIIDDINILN